MKKWRESRNYRRIKDENGNIIANIITIDGEDVEVTEEVFLAYSQVDRRERYMAGEREAGRVLSLEQLLEDHVPLSAAEAGTAPSAEDVIWDDSPSEAYWLNWLEGKPFTTLFVDGNHENFDRLNELPVHQWQGGKVHYIRPHVIHLMRGQIFEIDGTTFFTMGGGTSHDIQDGILDPASPDFEREYWFKRRTRQVFRVKGVSWWAEELPSDVEYEKAVRNLEQVNWRVDCILTHCAPTSILEKMDGDYTPDRLTDFLQMVTEQCQFDYWFLGHYHRNQVIDERFIIQWEQMVELQWE